jgi:SSS family solute:Na+ symporter
MAIVFLVLAGYMVIVTVIKPLKEPVKMPVAVNMDTTVHPKTYLLGSIIIAATAVLYIIFW